MNAPTFAPFSATPLTRWGGDVAALHHWAVPLAVDQATELASAQLLSPDETARAARFHFPVDRRRYVVARAALRLLLALHLDRPAQAIQFTYGLHGKPVLSGTEGGRPHFNLTHSGDLAVMAVTSLGPVGVDVEVCRPVSDFRELAARFFAAEERALLESLDDRVALEAFFLCWTRKEAVLKALGTGLSTDLGQVVVTCRPGVAARVVRVPGATTPGWTLVHLTPSATAVGASAVAGPVTEITATTATPGALLAAASAQGLS
jgi:4'-phosphopantetheinyl transferase